MFTYFALLISSVYILFYCIVVYAALTLLIYILNSIPLLRLVCIVVKLLDITALLELETQRILLHPQ
jgi:hypothetical protein